MFCFLPLEPVFLFFGHLFGSLLNDQAPISFFPLQEEPLQTPVFSVFFEPKVSLLFPQLRIHSISIVAFHKIAGVLLHPGWIGIFAAKTADFLQFDFPGFLCRRFLFHDFSSPTIPPASRHKQK
jgi:hypothetical protein